jgi:pyridoxal phosphate enzyme (YggS family)
MSISENIARIQEQIATAARRAGRSEKDVLLMAVSKTFPVDAIIEAYIAGARIFGESKVQEFSGKAATLVELHHVEWHMIGHLQTNKSARAAELFSHVDSVDSLRLAQKLNSAAGQAGKKLGVLIEINVGGEAAKTGIALDSPHLDQILVSVHLLHNLEFRGLMTVPPWTENPEDARPFFRKLRELRDKISAKQLPGVRLDLLSMGMSHDFQVAIEEGSTCVRIGTAIFGDRSKT